MTVQCYAIFAHCSIRGVLGLYIIPSMHLIRYMVMPLLCHGYYKIGMCYIKLLSDAPSAICCSSTTKV